MNMSMRNIRLPGLLFAAIVVLTACGGGSGTTENPVPQTPDPTTTTGTVGVFITDAPTARFDKILVRVSQIDLLGSGGPVTVFAGDATIDLRQLENSGELLSLTDNVPPGSYSKIRMYVDDITLVDVADDGETVVDTIHPKIPANGKIELNPRGPLSVAAGKTLLLQIDIDGEKSFKYHETGNGEWRFRPVIFVESGDHDDFDRLARLYGRIDMIDYEDLDFRLCQTELLSDDDDSDDYGEYEHCVEVSVDEGTGLFGDTGDPIDFAALTDGDFATVAGYVDNDDDNLTDMDEDSDSDSDSDGSMGDDAPFEIDAVVVMQGEKGTFEPYKGVVEQGLDAATGEFTIDLDPDQGVETGGALLALFQDGTQVFDKQGMPLDPAAIAPDVRGYFEGRLVLSDVEPDVLKTALIVLNLAPQGEEVLRGEISLIKDRGFDMITDMGDRCVWTDNDTEVLLIMPDEGNGIRSDRGTLEGLEAGQSVDVYGEEEDDGCFEADTVIVDLTVDVVPLANRAPMADAGADATVDAGTSVMLDGTASMDPDGDELTYAWVLAAPDGSAAELTAMDTAKPSFTTVALGDYVAELTVSDGEFSDSDSVTITAVDPALNQAPAADAGPDQAVLAGDPVVLDGTGSSDPDGDMLNYAWTLAAPNGSKAELVAADTAEPSFTADVPGDYVAELTVSDGEFSDSDSVTITAVELVEVLDGETLYNEHCAYCHSKHKPFAEEPAWTAGEIQRAIDQNKGGMGFIDLTPDEIQAIADALAARP